jgi:hypothetical protein
MNAPVGQLCLNQQAETQLEIQMLKTYEYTVRREKNKTTETHKKYTSKDSL